MSASMSSMVEAASQDKFQSSSPMTPAGIDDHGMNMTQALSFSSGNPRIEETRGVMHLYHENAASSSSDLPVGRKPLACVIGVPNHMTYADFCQFCGSFIQNILEMRIVRNEGMEGYSVLMRFDNQDSADNFYKHFNGRMFSSLEAEICHVLFTVDIQYRDSIGCTQNLTMNPTEPPACAVCLERLDQEASGILITICNHSFHCNCISKWTDSSCPVCRYCQQQPEKSKCFICHTSQNLWICVICGFVGCGRYIEGHAIEHWKETEHCYSFEVETQRVWDYVGDNYVHRLIQSKTDGKLVELNSHCTHGDPACGSCSCFGDCEISEALLNSKVEAIVDEYNDLLTTQLENQKLYFESLLSQVREEIEIEKAEMVEKAKVLKLQKMQSRLGKCQEEKKFLDNINETLVKNQEIWKVKLNEIEEREKKTLKQKDKKIEQLEGQLQSLMLCLESGQSSEHLLDLCDGPAIAAPTQSSSRKISMGNEGKRTSR